MDDVEDVLPLLLRQESEHGDEISLKARERAPITEETLLSLYGLKIGRRGLGVLICYILTC